MILEDELKAKLLDDMEAFFHQRRGHLPPVEAAAVPQAAAGGRAGDGQDHALRGDGEDRHRHTGGWWFTCPARTATARRSRKFSGRCKRSRRRAIPVLLIVEELDAYLQGDDKARVLNVLDGIESPNNPQRRAAAGDDQLPRSD